MTENKNAVSRTSMAAKNVAWAYINMIATTVFKFISRKVFISTIGETYLGINGLYLSILGVLSLTELGIGSAMNFSLYKPVAEDDKEKIKSLMLFYKQAYRIVALVISVLGLAIVPFLKYLIKDADGVDHLVLYYLLFLFNTVSSYFVSYKYSLNSAEQKAYRISNINTIFAICTSIAEIIALLVFKSFLAYLLAQIVFSLLLKIYAACYLDKQYPYLKEDPKPLDKESVGKLFKDVKALIIHKFGDVAVNQTDNIIISAFLSVAITGKISNYMLVISTVESFLFILFNNITGSLGNLCATTDKAKQYSIYKIYDFISFWLFGFSAIAYAALFQPFTALMWGEKYVVEFAPILLIILSRYMVGRRIPLNNMKMARGIFAADQYLAFIQAIVNLVSSIIFVKLFGLIGVYMGTILSGLIPTLMRPVIVYKEMFDKPISDFLKKHGGHFLLITLLGTITYAITHFIMSNLNIWTFAICVVITGLLPNAILCLIMRKTDEFKYIKETVLNMVRKKTLFH